MYENVNYLNTANGEKYPQSIYHHDKTLKVIPGKGVTRKEHYGRVTGTLKYANDIVLPNMSYVKFKLSPYSHAKITSIDTSKAKALPGVIGVYTNDDMPNLVAQAPYNYVLMKEPFVAGDEVAAVVAEDEDILDDAIALIDVKYQELPFLLHAEDALKTGAPILRGDTNEYHTPTLIKRGDVAAGKAAAEVTIGPFNFDSKLMYEGTVARQHAGIESESSCSYWDGNRLTFWADTQTMHADVKTVAAQVGLPYNKVYFPWTGTGYRGGGKGGRGKNKLITSFLAMKLGRPVKCHADSYRHFSTGGCHQNQFQTISMGAKKDGTLTFVDYTDVGDGGNNSGACSVGMQMTQKLLTCPNILLTGRDFTLNNNTSGSPRCLQHPRASICICTALDTLAEACNMNPADFLNKNVFTGSYVGKDQDAPTSNIGSNPMPGLLTDIVNLSGFRTKWKGWKTPVSIDGSKRRGIGVAIHQCSHGAGPGNPVAITIKANDDGTFGLCSGGGEFGEGWGTAAQLMAAEELGVTADKVIFATIDTESMMESKGHFGSGGTRSEGTGVILAARDLKQKLFQLAIVSKLTTATAVDQLETADNNIYLKSDPTKKVAIKDVTVLASSTFMQGSTFGTPGGLLIGTGTYATKGISGMCWGASVAEVIVDVDTGEYSMPYCATTHDVGRVIFYSGALSQLQGGVMECLGRIGMEGIVRDQLTGIVLNGNYLDYRIPTYADLPAVDVIMNENIDEVGPFGAKGIAEPICNAPGNAFVNALYNAIGVRILNTPITPEKILVALGKG